jgi:hypothetical protein
MLVFEAHTNWVVYSDSLPNFPARDVFRLIPLTCEDRTAYYTKLFLYHALTGYCPILGCMTLYAFLSFD